MNQYSSTFVKSTLRTVFVALLIDILAFTIILPLFPRLLEHYEKLDGNNKVLFFFPFVFNLFFIFFVSHFLSPCDLQFGNSFAHYAFFYIKLISIIIIIIMILFRIHCFISSWPKSELLEYLLGELAQIWISSYLEEL